MNIEAQIRALLNRPDRAALLGDIDIPTLVLCGHMCSMERPEAVGRALLQWLD